MSEHEELLNKPVVGDKVAVPAGTVGDVEARETVTVGDCETECFRIRLPSGATVWIPVGHLADHGVRHVMSEEQLEQMFEASLGHRCPKKRATWNRRQRRYREMLLSNEPERLGELLGELAAVREAKGTLSFGERRLYEKVEAQIIAELAVTLEIEEDAAAERLEHHLEEAYAAA